MEKYIPLENEKSNAFWVIFLVRMFLRIDLELSSPLRPIGLDSKEPASLRDAEAAELNNVVLRLSIEETNSV